MLSIRNVLLTAGEETPRYQELVTLVPWNFIAQILNLFLQMFLIKKFLFKPIREVLEKRKAKADAEISDATKAKEEALAMKAEYEQNMLEARDKANAILADATKTASAKSDEILKEASANAIAIKAKAEKKKADQKARIEAESKVNAARAEAIAKKQAEAVQAAAAAAAENAEEAPAEEAPAAEETPATEA